MTTNNQFNEGVCEIFRIVAAARAARRGRPHRPPAVPAVRAGPYIYRSASVPARQDGALQRLKATSLSALLAHFSTDSAGVSRT